jgi:hypothetical protein
MTYKTSNTSTEKITSLLNNVTMVLQENQNRHEANKVLNYKSMVGGIEIRVTESTTNMIQILDSKWTNVMCN